MSPRAVSLPRMHLPTVFSLLLLLLLSLLRGRYFLLPLRLVCMILAAGVLLLCDVIAADVLLFFPPFLPLKPPPIYYPVLRYIFFVPPNSRLFRQSYILVSFSRP